MCITNDEHNIKSDLMMNKVIYKTAITAPLGWQCKLFDDALGHFTTVYGCVRRKDAVVPRFAYALFTRDNQILHRLASSLNPEKSRTIASNLKEIF